MNGLVSACYRVRNREAGDNAERDVTERLGPGDRDLLLKRIDDAWDELQDVVRPLDEQRLSVVPPGSDWSVKDHLAHIAVWLDVAVARVTGTPDNAPFGLDEESFRTASDDELNDAANRLHKDRPVDEVVEDLRQAHTKIVTLIEGLTEAGLARPLKSLRPLRRTVMDILVSTTSEHYREHSGWIRALVP